MQQQLLHLISDLHLEFRPWEFPTTINQLEDRILVIAGDLCPITRNVKSYKQFLTTASKKYQHVIVIAGNHEYYGTTISNAETKLKNMAAQFHNVHYLQCDSIILNNEIEFLGCTLWSNVESVEMWSIQDGAHIKKFSLEEYQKLHLEHVKWLQTELAKPKKVSSRVVITHHLPSFECIHPKYHSYGSTNCFFASTLEHDLITSTDFWLHGHTHTGNQIKISNTFIISNPRGYPGENNDHEYRPKEIIYAEEDEGGLT
jgi:predicted phosphohydrolase